MIFLDSNVIIYAVGGEHPLQASTWEFFREIRRNPIPLIISAEVLQELLHVFAATRRVSQWDDALALLDAFAVEIHQLMPEDVISARRLYDRFPQLQARDLCHLAVCQRVGASSIKTFDNNLEQAATSLLR